MSDVPDDFVAAAKVEDVAEGTVKFAAIDRERIVLAQIEGRFYALRDMCGHRNAPLSRGQLVEKYFLECPLHYALFDMRDGAFITGPQSVNVPSYEVRVEGGTVYVKARSLAPDYLTVRR